MLEIVGRVFGSLRGDRLIFVLSRRSKEVSDRDYTYRCSEGLTGPEGGRPRTGTRKTQNVELSGSRVVLRVGFHRKSFTTYFSPFLFRDVGLCF